MKIKLTVTKMHGSEEKPREILFSVDDICAEDWFEADRKTIMPNCCKISANGFNYKANMSRKDLEALLEKNGVKIIKP